MKIEKNVENNVVTLNVSGKLDTVTAPEFEKVIDEIGEDSNVTVLKIDMKDLSYASSAGLRAILRAHKLMMTKGSMEVLNVNDLIMEIFEMTGFSDILTIK